MRRAEIFSQLLRRANRAAPDLLAADVALALADAGGDHLVLYVVDYEESILQPIHLATALLDRQLEGITVAGTMAGRAYQTQSVISAQVNDGWRIWAPLRERAERIGVLEAGFRTIDDELISLCEDLGYLVGHLIRTASRYTDVVEVGRRRVNMSLPAELQWDMLPPLAFASPEVAVAGRLEPAYDVGGDAFDYSLNENVLSFAFLDAMGHNLRSSLASALVLAGHRHGRRRGLDLIDSVRQIDETLEAEFGGEVFVTGHLGELDITTGQLSWINAGHPDPVIGRGSHVVAQPHAKPCLPLGLGIKVTEVGEWRLEPGDRLLFYSDGVIEARPASGDEFGIGRLVERFERHLSDRLVAAETLRRIVTEVLGHRGAPLQDDASLMLIEWRSAD